MEEKKKPTKKKSTSSVTKKKTTTVKKTTTPKKKTTTTKKSTPTKKVTTVKKTTVVKKTTTPKKKPVVKKVVVKKEVEPVEEHKVVTIVVKRKPSTRTKKKVTDSKTNAINDINKIINSIEDVAEKYDEKVEYTPEPEVHEKPKIEFDDITPAEEDYKYEGPAEEPKITFDDIAPAEEDYKYEEPAEEPKITFDDIEPAEEDFKYEGPVIEETNTIFDEPMDEVVIEQATKEKLTPQTDSIEEQVDITPVKTKTKLKPASKIVIFLLLLGLIGFAVYIGMDHKKVGKEIVNNSSYSNNLGVVEFKCVNKKLNNVIINSNMINDMKNKDSKYTKKIKAVLKDTNSNSYLVTNIKNALELKIITENDTLTEYYYKVLGFDNLDDLISLFEETIDSLKKNQK